MAHPAARAPGSAPGGAPCRPGGREPKPYQPNKWFWVLLAAPGMIWLVVLFVIPFYAMLAIGEGKLDRQTESPVAVYNPLDLELGQPLQRPARPVRVRRLRRLDRLADHLVRRRSPRC